MLTRTYFMHDPDSPLDGNTRYRGGLYRYKSDPNEGITFYCNGDSAKVKRIANSILDKVQDPDVLRLIYEYSEARVDEARGDWYENEAGESL